MSWPLGVVDLVQAKPDLLPRGFEPVLVVGYGQGVHILAFSMQIPIFWASHAEELVSSGYGLESSATAVVDEERTLLETMLVAVLCLY